MTGWEIQQALRTILSHDDAVIETGLVWLDPAELDRLSGLLRRLLERRQAQGPSWRQPRRIADLTLPHPANRDQGS